MRDGSREGRHDSPEQHAVEIARDPGRKDAETVFDPAVSQAAHRDAAALVERNAAYLRHATAIAAHNAKIREEQASADALKAEEGSFLRRKLVRERKAPSSNTFGLAVILILAGVGCIAGGVYYVSSQNSAPGGVATGVTSGVTAVSSSSKASDVSAPATAPPTIHVRPAPIQTETTVPGIDAENSSLPAVGSSDAKDLPVADSSAASGNLAGAVLHSDDVKPVAGPGAGNGNVNVSGGETEAIPVTQPKSDKP